MLDNYMYMCICCHVLYASQGNKISKKVQNRSMELFVRNNHLDNITSMNKGPSIFYIKGTVVVFKNMLLLHFSDGDIYSGAELTS